MSKQSGGLSIFLSLLSYVSLALVWLFFAPTRLGGQATYIMINGNSMEPGYHFGDLAILRSTDDYSVGDVAAYRDAQLQSLVIHRILSVNPDGYVFKGDHNYWVDEYHPARSEMIGKVWIHLPKVGLFFAWARTPINLAIIAGILGGIFMVTNLTGSARQGKTRQAPNRTGSPAEGWVLAIGFLAFAFLILGIFSFARPLKKPAAAIPYQHMGTFLYSAPGKTGVYDTSTVSSGEPIFLKLTCVINIGYAYNLTAAQAENIGGTGQLVAKVVDEQSGWERTLPLGSAVQFSGLSYRSIASLDLCQVEALVASMEQATGFHASTYTLTLQAQTTVAGLLSGQNFADTFTPEIKFRFDSVHFYLVAGNAQSDPLKQTRAGAAASSALVANTFPILGLKPSVGAVRFVSGIGFSISLAILGFLGMTFYGRAPQGESKTIALKYGSMVVDVYDRGVETVSPVIETTSMQDLAKIAERQNSMILHLVRNRIHYYLVQNNGTTYRYYVDESGNAGALRTAGQKVTNGGLQ
jgi:signal peptidase I